MSSLYLAIVDAIISIFSEVYIDMAHIPGLSLLPLGLRSALWEPEHAYALHMLYHVPAWYGYGIRGCGSLAMRGRAYNGV